MAATENTPAPSRAPRSSNTRLFNAMIRLATLLLSTVLFALILADSSDAHPTGVGEPFCHVDDIVAAMAASPHGPAATEDGGYRLIVRPLLNSVGELTGRYNVMLSASGSFKGVYLTATHNRTRTFIGTFQPFKATTFPFNIQPRTDCNTSVGDHSLLQHTDSQPKTGFSVNWFAGRWRRWNNMIVKLEAIVVEDQTTWHRLEPFLFVYKSPPTTTTSTATATATLEPDMYFYEPSTPETQTTQTTQTLTYSETTKTVDYWKLIATKIVVGGKEVTRTTQEAGSSTTYQVRRTKTRTTTEVGPTINF